MHDKSILVTGCSSGIGRCVALGLRDRGYRVFATARRDQDIAQLLGDAHSGQSGTVGGGVAGVVCGGHRAGRRNVGLTRGSGRQRRVGARRPRRRCALTARRRCPPWAASPT